MSSIDYNKTNNFHKPPDLKFVLNLAKMGYWSWLKESGEVNWSPELFKLFGYEPDEFKLSSDSSFRVIHFEDREKINKAISENLKTGNDFSFEFRGIHKYGRILYIWSKISPIKNEEGVIIGLYGITQDITKRKQKEIELKEERENSIKLYNKLNNSLNLLKKDIHTARKLQQSIFPALDHLNSFSPLEFSVLYEPFTDIGGDIFDISLLRSNHYRLFLADASGHGVNAALVTIAIKSEYESIKSKSKYPNQALMNLNKKFISKFDSLQTFFTGVIVDINLENDIIEFSSGGHIPQIIIYPDKSFKLLPKQGKLLAYSPEVNYNLITEKFPKGSKLILFTDGITEIFDREENEFSEESLYEFLSSNSHLSGEELIKELNTFQLNYSENGTFFDDRTLMCIDYTNSEI